MVEEIYNLKNQFVQRMKQEVSDRGIERVDIGEAYKMADIIKDLAEAEKACWEAEYYRSVTEAMGQSQGYTQQGQNGSMGYQQGMGYRQSGRGSANQYGGYRRGYSMGYSMDSLREAMQMADPSEKERMRQELLKMAQM